MEDAGPTESHGKNDDDDDNSNAADGSLDDEWDLVDSPSAAARGAADDAADDAAGAADYSAFVAANARARRRRADEDEENMVQPFSIDEDFDYDDVPSSRREM